VTTTALDLEKKYLYISSFGNILVGCVGIVCAAISSSQAVMLDGLFNLTYFATGLFTVKVASLVAGGDDARFPHGYAFFEPLVNGMKGVLVLGVSVMAMVGAVYALIEGGRPIAAEIAVGYGIFASIACWAIAYITHRGAKATHSPLVRADAENWIVNAAISSCVLIAFAGIFLFRALGLDAIAVYVDPVVVLTVVVISIGVPVRMAWKALMELLNRAPTGAVVQEVTKIVDAQLEGLPVQERFVRVVQPGRQRIVLVHVVLDADYNPGTLQSLDALRTKTFEALSEAHYATILDMLFTSDRQWGAPLSDGGSGGPDSRDSEA
jgi:cation diffusion facilitator family transporter